jgi:hypothetical protein
MGPFSSFANGDQPVIADALAALVTAAFDSGATRLSIQLEAADTAGDADLPGLTG